MPRFPDAVGAAGLAVGENEVETVTEERIPGWLRDCESKKRGPAGNASKGIGRLILFDAKPSAPSRKPSASVLGQFAGHGRIGGMYGGEETSDLVEQYG